MSDILDENKKASSSEEREDGMLIIFPDENDDEEEIVSTGAESDGDGESFSLSFGKVNAARKEEDFNFLPFLNIPEVVDEEEEDDDDGESFDLSFGKVSAAKKEQDYVYMPFLNVDENAAEEEQEEEKEEEEEDSGIDIVGGDDFFSMAPLKTKDSVSRTSSKPSSSVKNTKTASNTKKQNAPSPKKGKGNAPQKKKQPQRQAAPQKPNKVQQILAQMDPDIIASVSSDPRQMMMLEETIRSELIKQAAHNAVARELSSDVVEINDVPRKRPAQQQKQQQKPRNAYNQGKRAPENTLNFSRQELPRKNKPISIVDTSFISEFGSEPQQPQNNSQQPIIQNAAPVAQNQVQQLPNAAQATPIISQPVIVQPTIQTPPPVQQSSAAAPAQSTPRKTYTPTSPAAIRAAMKSGAISFDTPSAPQSPEPAAESATASAAQSVQNRRRMEIQKQLGEKRSGCVIGAIALLMIVFIGIIALISGGDIVTQCNYNEEFSRAQALVASNDYLGAIDVLNEIKGYSQTASLLNECYYALGQKAEAEGDFETAISYYESCVEYDSAIRGKLNLMKMQADDYRKSAESSNDIEDYLNAYTLYVKILSDLETYPEITNESESKEIQNKTDSTRFAYAKLLFGAEKYSDAKVHFDNLMASSYAEANVWYYNTCYNLGRVYFESGNYLSAYDELRCFENERHGIDSNDHLNAIAYLALSTLYKMENPAEQDIDTLQTLFALFTMAREGDLEEGLMTELENGMESDAFHKIKLIGSWNNDAGNYIVFSDGSITFYVSNEAEGGLMEAYSEEVIFDGKNISIIVDGTKYVIMENVAFEAKYQMAPRTLTFYNPFDGLSYTMYRFR